MFTYIYIYIYIYIKGLLVLGLRLLVELGLLESSLDDDGGDLSYAQSTY